MNTHIHLAQIFGSLENDACFQEDGRILTNSFYDVYSTFGSEGRLCVITERWFWNGKWGSKLNLTHRKMSKTRITALWHWLNKMRIENKWANKRSESMAYRKSIYVYGDVFVIVPKACKRNFDYNPRRNQKRMFYTVICVCKHILKNVTKYVESGFCHFLVVIRVNRWNM